MLRRVFLKDATLAVAGAALAHPAIIVSGRRSMRADLVLRDAVVYDGTGAAPFEGDVTVADGRIGEVGPRLSVRGAQEVSLRGLALAPGFIDIHGHTDLSLLVDPRAESKLRQGVTTEVTGQDGASVGPWTEVRWSEVRDDYRERYGVEIDFRDLAGFFRRLDAQGAALNVASMVGTGTVRSYVMGEDDRPPTAGELERMVAVVGASLGAGACGVSSGLEYTPGAFATAAELEAVVSPLRGTGLPYATHMRNEDDRLIAAVEEALGVGQRAGVAVQVSHLKAQGRRNWWKTDPVLGLIEAARATGVDVWFDCYPYVAYSTGLANLFPVQARDGGTAAFLARLEDPELRPRLESAVREKIAMLGSWDAVQLTSARSAELAWVRGRRLGELAEERRVDPYELLVRIILGDRNRARMVGFGMREENVARKLAHPLAMVCSDGGARAVSGPLSEGTPHPRSYGAFPRLLGEYCRERELMPLETAIHKITGMPAARLRLADRGRIAAGAVADLVAFDPDRVRDRATFEEPHQYPDGIPHVLVRGRFVLRDGEPTGALPGRSVRPTATDRP